eukprot:XP_001703644.1 predicted protein [Chlamydomonas reinhardtii]
MTSYGLGRNVLVLGLLLICGAPPSHQFLAQPSAPDAFEDVHTVHLRTGIVDVDAASRSQFLAHQQMRSSDGSSNTHTGLEGGGGRPHQHDQPQSSVTSAQQEQETAQGARFAERQAALQAALRNAGAAPVSFLPPAAWLVVVGRGADLGPLTEAFPDVRMLAAAVSLLEQQLREAGMGSDDTAAALSYAAAAARFAFIAHTLRGLDVANCYFYDPAVPFMQNVKTDSNGMQYFLSSTHRKLRYYLAVVQVWTPGDLGRSYFNLTYRVGARVHSDSWGSDLTAYDSMAAALDRFTWNNPDFLSIFAAGNYGTASGATTTVTSPAVAKNCIAAGATPSMGTGDRPGAYGVTVYNLTATVNIGGGQGGARSVRVVGAAFGGDLAAAVSAAAAANGGVVALAAATPADACIGLSNAGGVRGRVLLVQRGSSFGPTTDGRIKPDITAPGHLLSANANPTLAPDGAVPSCGAGATRILSDGTTPAGGFQCKLTLEVRVRGEEVAAVLAYDAVRNPETTPKSVSWRTSPAARWVTPCPNPASTGYYTFSLRAVDAAGNVGDPTPPLFFAVDASLPPDGAQQVQTGGDGGSSNKTTQIVIGVLVLVGVLLAIAAIVAVVVLRRRALRKRQYAGAAAPYANGNGNGHAANGNGYAANGNGYTANGNGNGGAAVARDAGGIAMQPLSTHASEAAPGYPWPVRPDP